MLTFGSSGRPRARRVCHGKAAGTWKGLKKTSTNYTHPHGVREGRMGEKNEISYDAYFQVNATWHKLRN